MKYLSALNKAFGSNVSAYQVLVRCVSPGLFHTRELDKALIWLTNLKCSKYFYGKAHLE